MTAKIGKRSYEMTTISMPCFTAEISLEKTNSNYHIAAVSTNNTHVIQMQVRILGTGPGAYEDICSRKGKILNNAYQQSISNSDPYEAAEWRQLANDIYAAEIQRGSVCTYSVQY
jgi:hypothetical protein